MNLISKITGVAVTLALAAVVAAPSASALTSADIQLLVSLGVIPADKAEAAMAVADNGSAVGNATTSCGFTYTRNLTLGSTGADVVALQTYLESKGFLTIPAGVSKGYFGPLTRSSLASYQTAMGIAPAVGYFGPITMGRVTADCTTTGGNNGGDTTNGDLSGGEASLNNYDRQSTYTNEDLEEGDTEKVFEAEFEVEDGDVRIERVDVRLQAADANVEDEPWEQIESIALYINGDMVDEMDVDDEDDWSDESGEDFGAAADENDSYEIRFSGINEIIRENDDAVITIEVTASDRIDDGDLPADWYIWIPRDGIRAIDGEGIDQYEGSESESTKFTIETADNGDVKIRESDDNPDSAILIVDEDDDSSEYEVFRFEIDNDDADVFMNTLTITATTSAADVEDVISQLMVSIDGEEFDFDTFTTGVASVNGIYEFDFEDNDDEVPIEDGETVEVVVLVEFNQTGAGANYDDGEEVQFGVYSDLGVEFEGQSSGDVSDDSGSQESEVHVLRTEGIVAEGVSKSATVDEAEFSGEEEKGVYEIEIQVTALEEDAYIANTVGTSTQGFVFEITESGTTFVGENAVVQFISESTEDVNGGYYRISEGSSERFTVRVELDPATTGAFGIELTEINFNDVPSLVGVSTYTVPDEAEFETKKISIDA